jgi:hypothetical protein
MGPIADDADWLKLTEHDYDEGDIDHMGDLAISLQVGDTLSCTIHPLVHSRAPHTLSCTLVRHTPSRALSCTIHPLVHSRALSHPLVHSHAFARCRSCP